MLVVYVIALELGAYILGVVFFEQSDQHGSSTLSDCLSLPQKIL